MTSAAAQIGLTQTPRGILVRLPACFWLLVSLRRTVPRLLAAEAAWAYLAPAAAAIRLEQWIAEVELQLDADRRRRAWTATDAEWSDTAAVPPPAAPPAAPEPIVVKVPTEATTRATLRLLEQLRAGERLVCTPTPGAAPAPRVFVLRPSGLVVRTSVAQRAIDAPFIQPAGDGLFGPETSQTWFLPSSPPSPEARP